MTSDRSISVVIPVLDEERRIGRCLEAVLAGGFGCQITVVDGGSRDATADVVRGFEPRGVRLIRACRGRGPQMNAGAKASSGAILLFLHADAILPADGMEMIRRAMDMDGVAAGAFTVRTVSEGSAPWLRLLLRLADVRSRYTRLPYGDQALFVDAAVFRAEGGFAEIPLMEDIEFASRLRRRGRMVRIPSPVTVSGRRFSARPLRTALIMRAFPLLFRMGIPPSLLERIYGHPR